MRQGGLEQFGAYRKARELFDLVVRDMEILRADPRCYRLVAQQVASADSICANIEEGYGRLSRAEYVRFLDFARGSARETRGRYERMRYRLADQLVRERTRLADEIIAILTSTIERLRTSLAHDKNQAGLVREPEPDYDDPVPVDAPPSEDAPIEGG